jgi:site-specific recombinase XerD
MAETPDRQLAAVMFADMVGFTSLMQKIWKPAVKEAGLPDALRIHDLRHTAASFMIFEGAHLELVHQQLGHSSVTVTQRYAHLYPSQGEDLATRLDARRSVLVGRVVGL